MRIRFGFAALIILGGLSDSAAGQRRASDSTALLEMLSLFRTPTRPNLAFSFSGAGLPTQTVWITRQPVIDSTPPRVHACPMPVLPADSARLAPMPVMRRRSLVRDSMPVLL